MDDTAKLIIEVRGGLVPGEPDPELTRRWAVSGAEFEDAARADEQTDPEHAAHRYLLLAFRGAQADEYARTLRNPDRCNWVSTDWIWL